LKDAGVFDETANKRKSDYLKNKKLSTKAAEIVCESFCHLFTMEGHKLSELKTFYRSVVLFPTIAPHKSPSLPLPCPPLEIISD
jgi:hypothetical protein